MDLRDVGLHCPAVFEAEMQETDLGRCSANDAAQCQHIQRAQNACTVAEGPSLQFSSATDG